MTRLLVEDVDLARGRVRIRRAKGGEPKEYPMPRDLFTPVRKYLRKRVDHGPYQVTVEALPAAKFCPASVSTKSSCALPLRQRPGRPPSFGFWE